MRAGAVSGLLMTLWASIFLLAGLFPRPALATHEADHRFTVYGYVRDDRGNPIKGERVIIVDTRTDQARTAFTDQEGYYEGLLHLHNDNLGDEVAVMVGDQRKTVRATFDPEDLESERKVQIDFGAESTSAGEVTSLPTWVYGMGALVVLALIFGAFRYGKRSKKSGRKRQSK